MVENEYCYSLNEESYQGKFKTESDAADSAMAELNDQCDPGVSKNYWVAKVAHPIDAYGESTLASSIAENVVEQLVMWCDEELGAEEPCMDISKDDEKELGMLIVSFFRSRASVQYFGVKDPSMNTFIVGSNE